MAGDATDVEQGRQAFADQRWADSYEALRRADEANELDGDGLELLGMAAGLTGRDEEMLTVLERLYHADSEAGRPARAARAAFWIAMRSFAMGEPGKGGGWIGRAQRAVEDAGSECAARGYLLVPVILRQLGQGENHTAHDTAAEAVAIGRRCGDDDLVMVAQQLQGRALIRLGKLDEGMALLDEAMLAASRGELSPIVTGIVLCSVIATCHQVYALDRATEWTTFLSEWCEGQPQLVSFTGTCLVHRAEIMQLGGDWQRAADEAQRVAERHGARRDPEAVGDAHYQHGEVLRLRGDFEGAEDAYRRASEHGREPQPGLALLRLAQGKTQAAAGALNRVLAATSGELLRAQYLPAHVEVQLAAQDIEGARASAEELGTIAGRFGTEVLGAIAAHARGAVRLAAGDASNAVDPLQQAFRVWQQVGAPYIAARIRMLLGQAFRDLGDEDGFALEIGAARKVFEELGAQPALDHLAELEGGRPARGADHGLTAREQEVLSLLAEGMTNKAIAKKLGVSERTVDRHVSNIFGKLDVSTRSAATAFAYENGLV